MPERPSGDARRTPALRIVLVMMEPPLPFGNASARWYYVLLRGLVARGHRVTAFAVCGTPEELVRARDLFPASDYDLRLFPFPARRGPRSKWETWRQPYSYPFSPDLRRDLDAALAQGFDILHLEQLWSGWLGLRHRDRALINVHYLFRIDQEEWRPKTWRGRARRWMTFGAERRLLRQYQFIRAVSPRLEGAVGELNPRADLSTVPLGLEISLYRYIPDEQRSSVPVVTLIGTMDWSPTYSAAVRLLTRLWPEIKRQVPAARLQIVGWSARARLADFLTLPDVSVAENVPEIQPYFERASVLLYAPGRGSGMKVKVQEAMAFGVPVVTTSEGVEGLPAEDGRHAGVCEDDAGLIRRTVALLRDPDLQNRQRRAARQLLETHCGPTPTLDALEKVYARTLGHSRSEALTS
jgi:polysaccharide biosynthesis protein PslH